MKLLIFYIHTSLTLIPEGVAVACQIYRTGGKPIAVWSQSISGVKAINPLVTFYDIHGRKRDVLFFYIVRGATRGMLIFYDQ
jgi:hypothetical protein